MTATVTATIRREGIDQSEEAIRGYLRLPPPQIDQSVGYVGRCSVAPPPSRGLNRDYKWAGAGAGKVAKALLEIRRLP